MEIAQNVVTGMKCNNVDSDLYGEYVDEQCSCRKFSKWEEMMPKETIAEKVNKSKEKKNITLKDKVLKSINYYKERLECEIEEKNELRNKVSHIDGRIDILIDIIDDLKHDLMSVGEEAEKILYDTADVIKNELPFMGDVQRDVFKSVLYERYNQDNKWGEQNHDFHKWVGILGEEFGELCEAVNETVFENENDKGGYESMKKEAVQVAAVAIAFLECLERNKSDGVIQ